MHDYAVDVALSRLPIAFVSLPFLLHRLLWGDCWEQVPTPQCNAQAEICVGRDMCTYVSALSAPRARVG